MKLARIAFLLHVCLVACVATAATPEQEIHEEVQKLFPTIFTKCGDDYFSKQTLDFRYGDAYFIGQYKALAAGIEVRPPSTSEGLLGIVIRPRDAPGFPVHQSCGGVPQPTGRG